MLILAVTGGRDYQDRDKVYSTLDAIYREHGGNMTLILGDATGVDTLAKDWADDRKVLNIVHWADWKAYGKAAGPLRNKEMVKKAGELLAFPGGRGTANCTQQAIEAGLPIRVVQ